MRTLRLAREAGGWSLVKLEVLSNTAHLYPDMIETLRATEMLVKDGLRYEITDVIKNSDGKWEVTMKVIP